MFQDDFEHHWPALRIRFSLQASIPFAHRVEAEHLPWSKVANSERSKADEPS